MNKQKRVMVTLVISCMLFISITYSYYCIADPGGYEGFFSINSGENNSVVSDEIYDFNWTKNDTATYYRLQIANDSAFTDIWFNETINATTFPGNYTEQGNYIEFTLPTSYRQTWNKDYYFRYKSGYYYTG
jgi:hypothetical protein